MLDSLRKKKDNFVYSVILLATAAVMAFYGVGKFQSSNSAEGAAAWVNGDVITRGEFRQELAYRMEQYQSLLGGQYDEKFLSALQIPQRTLDELIQFKLLAQQAQKMNIIVPDRELADYIRGLPYYQKDGKFDAETYSKLPNRGIQEKRQRERLEVQKLQTYLSDRVKLTPAAVKDAYALRDTKVDLQYAKIDFQSLASSHPPSDREINDYLKTNPDKELQGYYDAHKKDFTDKAQVNLKQIRASIPFQATETQKSQAKGKIQDLALEVTPANFSTEAKAKSDDEYAKKGGAVGWVTRGTLEPGLEAALDKLDPGKVSPVIETSFGYYLLLVTDKKDAVVHPLSEVKRKIAGTLITEKNKMTFADKTQKEWDKLLADGKPLDGELKKYKVEMKKTGPFSVGQGYIPNVGQADTLVDALFDLTKDQPSPKKLIPFQNSFFYLRLVSVENPKEADLTKDAETIEKSVGTALQTELVSQFVAKLQKKATVKTEVNFESRRDTEVD